MCHISANHCSNSCDSVCHISANHCSNSCDSVCRFLQICSCQQFQSIQMQQVQAQEFNKNALTVTKSDNLKILIRTRGDGTKFLAVWHCETTMRIKPNSRNRVWFCSETYSVEFAVNTQLFKLVTMLIDRLSEGAAGDPTKKTGCQMTASFFVGQISSD